MVIEDCQPT